VSLWKPPFSFSGDSTKSPSRRVGACLPYVQSACWFASVFHCQRLSAVAARYLGLYAYEDPLFQIPIGSDSVWVYGGGPSSPPPSALSSSTDVQPTRSESGITFFTTAPTPSSVSVVPCTTLPPSFSDLTTVHPHLPLPPSRLLCFLQSRLQSYVIYHFNLKTDQRCVIVPRPSCRCHCWVCPRFRRRLALAALDPHLRA